MARAYRDASEPEGSMTNPSEALIDGLSPIERLAEHLCARRPCGDTPENVADWLDYSLNRCGLVVIEEQRLVQQAATPAAPVQDDDAELVNQLNRLIDGWNGEGDLKVGPHMLAQGLVEARDAIANRLTPDRVTPLVEALRDKIVELWHETEAGRGELRDYLCMTDSEYAAWLVKGTTDA